MISCFRDVFVRACGVWGVHGVCGYFVQFACVKSRLSVFLSFCLFATLFACCTRVVGVSLSSESYIGFII